MTRSIQINGKYTQMTMTGRHTIAQIEAEVKHAAESFETMVKAVIKHGNGEASFVLRPEWKSEKNVARYLKMTPGAVCTFVEYMN